MKYPQLMSIMDASALTDIELADAKTHYVHVLGERSDDLLTRMGTLNGRVPTNIGRTIISSSKSIQEIQNELFVYSRSRVYDPVQGRILTAMISIAKEHHSAVKSLSNIATVVSKRKRTSANGTKVNGKMVAGKDTNSYDGNGELNNRPTSASAKKPHSRGTQPNASAKYGSEEAAAMQGHRDGSGIVPRVISLTN
jgi:hypothetical protein